MANQYLNYISDEHLLSCIKKLHHSYLKAKNDVTKAKFYKNKIDIIKLTFDTKFNDIDEEGLIESESLRQIDKSINNSIGTFHENILGGIEGYQSGKLSGYDIKSEDDTLFADIKNKHNTMNSSAAEALFQKLATYANNYKKSKCYWVQILANSSFESPWSAIINGKEYSHTRVLKISGDRFYSLLTGEDDALFQLYNVIPAATEEYLSTLTSTEEIAKNSALFEIKELTSRSNRTMLDQITFDNYSYYKGFENI